MGSLIMFIRVSGVIVNVEFCSDHSAFGDDVCLMISCARIFENSTLFKNKCMKFLPLQCGNIIDVVVAYFIAYFQNFEHGCMSN